MNLGVKSVHSRNWGPAIAELRGQIADLQLSVDDPAHDHPNAIHDLDGVLVRDLDGKAVYEPGTPIDNPSRPTRHFRTVADMLASESGPWDRAMCHNWDESPAGTGILTEWVMVVGRSPGPVSENILLMNDGIGYAVRSPQL